MKSIINFLSKIFKARKVVKEEESKVYSEFVSQIKYEKQYARFVKRMGKHKSWFDILSEDQKRKLFRDWEIFKSIHKDYLKKGFVTSASKPSFRKFIYLSKSKKYYFIPKTVIREKLIDSLLN